MPRVVVVVVLFVACVVAVIPPPKRPAVRMVVTTDVADVSVQLKPWSYSGWIVRVDNRRNEPLRIVWDESSFIAADGVSRGRLIRGQTRVLDAARAFYRVTQPNTPIAPRSMIVEYAVPDTLATWIPGAVLIDASATDEGAKTTDNIALCFERRRACKLDGKTCASEYARCRSEEPATTEATEATKPAFGTAHPSVKRGVGRLVLTFDGPRGRETWDAAISFDGSPLPAVPPKAIDAGSGSAAE